MNLTHLKNSDDPGELEAAVDIDARGKRKTEKDKSDSTWAMRQLGGRLRGVAVRVPCGGRRRHAHRGTSDRHAAFMRVCDP